MKPFWYGAGCRLQLAAVSVQIEGNQCWTGRNPEFPIRKACFLR